MRDFKLVIFLFIVSIVLTISKANAFTFANGTNRSLVNNIGEEYRWNTPLLTYAYDESFINYFGENGILAIEDAIELADFAKKLPCKINIIEYAAITFE